MKTIILLLLPLSLFGQDRKVAISEIAIGGATVMASVPLLVYGLANHADNHDQSSIAAPMIATVFAIGGGLFMADGIKALRKQRNNLSLSSTSNGLTLTYRF